LRLDRCWKERFGLQPVSVTADKGYGTGEILSWLSNRQMTPYIPVLDRKQQTKASTRSMSLLAFRKKTLIAVQQVICFDTSG
jgi:hypothetical protein